MDDLEGRQKIPGDHWAGMFSWKLRSCRDLRCRDTCMWENTSGTSSCICPGWKSRWCPGGLWLRKHPAAVGCLTSVSQQDWLRPGGGRSGWAVSALAGKPVKNEGGRTHLPGSSQLCRHGDWWPQFKPQETQGGLPRGEQQVQVWRVRHTHC